MIKAELTLIQCWSLPVATAETLILTRLDFQKQSVSQGVCHCDFNGSSVDLVLPKDPQGFRQRRGPPPSQDLRWNGALTSLESGSTLTGLETRL